MGEEAHLYDDLEQILNKIYHEVSDQHKKRKQEVLGSNSTAATKWTNVEVAQLLVAVYNMGEGEWTEIQKRLNFQSSGVVKTPNQVAHRWQ
ncbi:MAG: SANT/Myb-like DNA-binding domain-containing protein [Promethearchaeia archaeon]